ncbi:MAG: citramalate synthase [Dehalococcoidia bacterium]
MKIQLYDTTLRDGAQQEGISFSVEDKLRIARKLDELGVHFIEGGWPGSNPKDTEFFRRLREVKFANSVPVAFGSTRRPDSSAEADANLKSLLDAKTQVVTLVGKGSAEQVKKVLKTSLKENLNMVADSIGYLKSRGMKVFFDAEHFFDGYKDDAQYSRSVVKTAASAGADCIVLCDTNGGSLPEDIASICSASRGKGIRLGIHAHNDSELAVANTLAAVQTGVRHVQGTVNGYGERCGNANLCSIIPALQLKLGIDCISEEQLARITEVSRYVSEVANLLPDSRLPYVGASAFGHKAGIHISGMLKARESYQHIDPLLVGNGSRLIVSELSGINTVIYKAKELGLTQAARKTEAKKILNQVKTLESQGFTYDNAEASFELLLRRTQPGYQPPFELVDFMVVVERQRRAPTIKEQGTLSEAMVKVRVGEDIHHTAAEGNGPVNALDEALRKALGQFYPGLVAVKLVDYKVRILEESEGTEAKVRVLIESSDGEHQWHTVGSSTNIIEASWIALADSMEYWLLDKENQSRKRRG